MTMFNMMLGEVAPGGIGSGLYGMLVLAVITVFVAGLMVGRTPEYLGKKIGAREMKFASLYFLTTPIAGAGRHRRRDVAARRTRQRCSTPARTASPRCCTRSPRPRNNNGSAFAGHHGEHRLVQHRARVCACCSAGSCRSSSCSAWPGRWPGRQPVPASAGTLPTHRPLFVGMLVGVTVIVVAPDLLPGARARPAGRRPVTTENVDARP